MDNAVILRGIKAIAGALAAAGLLSACSAGEQAVRFDDGSLQADARLEEILDAVSQQDIDALEAMFSEAALCQTDDFSQQAESLYRLVQGDVESWERTGFTSAASTEDGEKNTENVSWYDVTTAQTTYAFCIIECVEDTENPDNVGLYMLAATEKSEEDSKFTYWQDMQVPGICIP